MKIDGRILKNYIFNSIYQVTCILIPIVTLPYLSRVLKTDALGRYSFAYSVAYYFYLFIRLGVNNYGNREIAQVRDNKQVMSTKFCEIYAFQFFMGIAISLLYAVYVFFISKDRDMALIFSLIVFSGGIDCTWFFYGLEEIAIVSIRDSLTKVGTLVLIIAFVRTSADVWIYALIIAGGFFLDQIIVLPLIIKKVDLTVPALSNIIPHIKPNLILFLPTIAVSFFKTMDKIMLGILSSKEELGYYYCCEKIVAVPLALIVALGTVMLPRMSNIFSNKLEEQQGYKLFDKSVQFAMFISSSICFGIMAVSNEFVPLFYGPGYDKCVSLFYVILPSCVFMAYANVIRTQYLLPRKMDTAFVVSLFLGAAVNIAINIVLIPSLGSIGAAYGTLFAEAVVCIVQVFFVVAQISVAQNLWDSFPYLVSGIIMFGVFRNYKPEMQNELWRLLYKIVVCGLSYLICAFVFILVMRSISRYVKRWG